MSERTDRELCVKVAPGTPLADVELLLLKGNILVTGMRQEEEGIVITTRADIAGVVQATAAQDDNILGVDEYHPSGNGNGQPGILEKAAQ